MIALGLILLGSVIVFALIEAAARALFDHVDMPKGDETAPPRDAP